MAHEIKVSDVFGEVRAHGERAWHGLGVELPEGLTAWEGFKKIGLDWETELVPVKVKYDGHDVVDPDSQMHIRKDNHMSLGIVGPTYKAISNRKLADFADNLCGADKAVRLETAGSLRNGRRVFCTVRLPKDIEVVDGDILEMYVVGSNAHDGTGAFQFYGSSIRVVCMNTLNLSEHSARNMVRFQHSGDLEAKVEVARASLGIIVKEADKYEAEIRRMVKKGLNKKQITAYFEAVYDFTFGAISSEWSEKQQITRAAHKSKQVAEWLSKMDQPNQTIKGIQGTTWAAFNAYSEWADHEKGRFVSVQEGTARVHNNLFGVTSRQKQKAWGRALALA